MQKVIETVNEHCKHEDCIYRFALRSYGCDFCNYCVIEGKSRGCPISQCDKYVKGERKLTMTNTGIWFEWLLEEEYDNDTVY